MNYLIDLHNLAQNQRTSILDYEILRKHKNYLSKNNFLYHSQNATGHSGAVVEHNQGNLRTKLPKGKDRSFKLMWNKVVQLSLHHMTVTEGLSSNLKKKGKKNKLNDKVKKEKIKNTQVREVMKLKNHDRRFVQHALGL